jgi:ABC-2 type transport system permease protein
MLNQALAWFDPVFHMNEAMKGVVARGLDADQVAGDLAFLAAFALASLASGVLSYRRMLSE